MKSKVKNIMTAIAAMVAAMMMPGCAGGTSDGRDCNKRAEGTMIRAGSGVERANRGRQAEDPCERAEIEAEVSREKAARLKSKRHMTTILELDGMTLRAEEGSAEVGERYTASALSEAEVAAMPMGMVNVTGGEGAGYRLLPGGEHFNPSAEIRIRYDEKKIPQGYTPEEVFTSYYDEAEGMWRRLYRKEVDTARREIVSLTSHFTDFVNEVIKSPEMPETQAFVPTMMSDIEAANPLEGLSMIQAPEANREGTANLSYPIWVPSGRGGMQPQLTLTYGSSGGDGWLGVGWDISVPSVALDTRWGVPRFDAAHETEVYLLGGEQLVQKDEDGAVVPLPHRTNRQASRASGEVRFYARTGDAHDSIVRHGGSPREYWWTVTDRMGVTHRYGIADLMDTAGNNYPFLEDSAGNIARWMLTESRDPYGNYVRYYYDRKGQYKSDREKQLYLSKIEYTGNGTTPGRYSVEFFTKDRSENDMPMTLGNGFREKTDKELCYILVKSGDTVICGYLFETENGCETNYKTRLRSVTKIDSATDEAIEQKLARFCSGTKNLANYAGARQEFEYYDAPEPSAMFGPEVRSRQLPTSDLKGFLKAGDVGDDVQTSTALGLTHSSSWNIGGTLGVGIGECVADTRKTIGGNFSREKSSSETVLTMVDLDGDGLADKVFVRGGEMRWQRQLPPSCGELQFAADHSLVEGVGHILQESSVGYTVGAQFDLVLGSGSGSWTSNVSTTSVYFADMNGDGLVDIVDNGQVYFNSLVAGSPTFTLYQDPEPADGEDSEQITVKTTAECGGILFDGEVNDSVGCEIVWELISDTTIAGNRNAAEEYVRTKTARERAETSLEETANGTHVKIWRATLDCSRRNLTKEVTPNTEAVRVWVAPSSGLAEITANIRLKEEESERRRQSRHADGVTYTIQQSKHIDTAGGLLSSMRDTLISQIHLCAECYDEETVELSRVPVSEGDILFFRLQSGDDKQFDDVEDDVTIIFTRENEPNSSATYSSAEDFVLTDENYFQAPYDGAYSINGSFSSDNGHAMLAVRHNSRASYRTDAQLSMENTIRKDSIISLTVMQNPESSVPVNWSNVSLNATITFHSDSLGDDALTMMTVGRKEVTHPTNCVWGDTTYQALFGPLYNGWGQFAYQPLGDGDVIDPSTLLYQKTQPLRRERDTVGIHGRLDAEEDVEQMGKDSIEIFESELGTMANPLTKTSQWVAMRADAEHERWVSFGSQSSVGSGGMSNALQDSWYSNHMPAEESDENVPSAPQCTEYDDPVPAGQNGTTAKGIRKVSRSKSIGFSAGALMYGASGSSGTSSVEIDCMDMNGDRYPDIVSTGMIQYRQSWGGMGDLVILPREMSDRAETHTYGAGVSFGSMSPMEKKVAEQHPIANKFTMPGDGNMSGSANYGGNRAKSSWADINGDGLPDRVRGGGMVMLNTGYSFLPPEDWNLDDEFQSGQNVSTSLSGGKKFNRRQGSIQCGAAISHSANHVKRQLTDLNGDNLPDLIWRDSIATSGENSGTPVGDAVYVKFNLGNGRWSNVNTINLSNFNWSETYNESLNAGYTVGVTILGLKSTVGVNGTPIAGSVSRDRMQLADVNNDGYPDLVYSDEEGELTVRYHQGGKTNLLKKVTNFTGGKIYLRYALSEPSHDQPSRIWLLDTVATKDPHNQNGGDSTTTAYVYSHPRYDRHERTFLGYGAVITKQIDSGAVRRVITKEYYNDNILKKGKPKTEILADGAGHIYVEKVYQHNYAAYDGGALDSCDYDAYTAMDRIETRYYEGMDEPQLTTAERYQYDRYHNVIQYVDEGDTEDDADGLRITFSYLTGQPSNLIGLRSEYHIFPAGSSNWVRHATFTYNAQGKVLSQTLHNSASTSVYEFEYDNAYGNLVAATLPENGSGDRMVYEYAYDSYVSTYPIRIENSYGETVETRYNLRYGKPKEVRDPSGNTMEYSYDYAGRLTAVRSPLNQSDVPSLTNEYFPINYYHFPMAVPYGHDTLSFSVTKHYDDAGSLVTKTAVISDCMGRAAQTKKGLMENGMAKMQVSGRAFTDGFGRTTRQYDPMTEDTNALGIFNASYDISSETAMRYDVQDRVLKTVQPLGTITQCEYSIDTDPAGHRRFETRITDPNGHVTEQYSDYERRNTRIVDAEGGVTVMEYDNLGQLTSATDPEGFVVTYEYDKLGHLTRRCHPDAGATVYSYDPAGNITQEQTALGHIYYSYHYQRVTDKTYSNLTDNDVHFTYGTTGNDVGRLISIADGTGDRQLSYDALGNVVEERRKLLIPEGRHAYLTVTSFEYDSWGRMKEMNYPDGERVYYHYQFGGDLHSMDGFKGQDHYEYINGITYNKFGQRVLVEYGNDVQTEYEYDALHRLIRLFCIDAQNNEMQHIDYNYDPSSNIIGMENNALGANGLGGAYVNEYSYDGLNRLTSATSQGNLGGFQTNMSYSPAGRLSTKNLSASSVTLNSSARMTYGYCDDQGRPHAPRRILDRGSGMLYDLAWDGAGNLNQINSIRQNRCEDSRFLFWTEDNRLHTVSDKYHHSYYAYDNAGERSLKITGDNSRLTINAEAATTSSVLRNFTLYPSPYVVLADHGYTKHYYMGSDRLCARIGGGALQDLMEESGATGNTATSLFHQCQTSNHDRVLRVGAANCAEGLDEHVREFQQAVNGIPRALYSDVRIDASAFDLTMAYYMNHEDPETEVYFYHSDHLGSASWITDANGDAVQHLQYLPYGELFVNQFTTGYQERFTFSGKERDEETGYSYFGARYYDADILTGWLSMDPMADKYPGINPYAYCAWNPVKLVDPDGMELYIPETTSKNHNQSKIDILSLVHKKNQGRVSFDANGKVSIDFSGLTGKKIDKLLYKDKGLALLDKMVVAEEKMLYECSDEYIDGNGTIHDMIERPEGIVNASNNGTDSEGGYTHSPAQGFDGHVVLAKSGRWERKQDCNWVNNKTSVLYHELDENYYRTVCGKIYKVAHELATTDEGFHYGNCSPGTFFSQGEWNRYSYNGKLPSWCMPK